MKLLQSAWGAALIGLISYLLTTYVCWTKATASLTPPPAATPEAEADKTTGPSWNFKNTELTELIDDLRERKQALQERESQLNDYASRLQTERAELTKLTERVAQMQAEFERLVIEVKKEEAANLKRLAKMYAAMTPDGAAAILREKTDSDIVKVMTLMKEAESGPLLEALGKMSDADTRRAATITDRLRMALSRNANAKPKS